MDNNDVEVAQVQQVNETRRKLTKGALAAPIVAATLASRNALACSPHHLTCSGKLSGNTSGHGPDGNSGCTMECNYNQTWHKTNCPDSARRRTDNPNYQPLESGYGRCFRKVFSSSGKKFHCKGTQNSSTKKYEWKLAKEANTFSGYKDATFSDMCSWDIDDPRWKGSDPAFPIDADGRFAVKACVLLLNAERANGDIGKFPLKDTEVKEIYRCAVTGTPFSPSGAGGKSITSADCRSWLEEIYSLSHS